MYVITVVQGDHLRNFTINLGFQQYLSLIFVQIRGGMNER